LALPQFGGLSHVDLRPEWWGLGLVSCGPFVVGLWSVVDRLSGKGCRQLSPQAALGFDLYFNCNEVDITHAPNLVKIFLIIFRRWTVRTVVLVVFGF
jgi:hypothetical protein